MEKIKKLFNTSKFKHHAYGFESHGLKTSDFDEFIDKKRFSYVFSKHYDSFKINDARTIKSLGVEKTDRESLFIISFTHINNEAQNTLLKLIEEPKSQTTFFFIFPNAKKILPTILSRLELISLNRVLDTQERKINAVDFIKMTLNERFTIIKSVTGKPKKGELAENKLNKADLQALLDDLEIFYIKQKPSQKRNKILETILNSRKYMTANGASIKMIIDNVSINL
ncbi:MAG: hypothetical protein LR005_02595 [Candidatus Pacebacteria bacterium]|nr:hypothetical protein [Candidatus Paceibacterota bacterium]